jgi:diguanylate cyclase (GGDEF)-like protein/PAS domain S-box-containing protein
MMPTGPDFHKELLDTMSDGVYFVNRERKIQYWNAGAHRLTGYSSDEVIGRRCPDDVLRHVDDGGRPLRRSACPLSACISDGRAREAVVYVQHKEGRRVPVLVRVQPMRDDTGAIVGAVEIFSDGSAQTEARRTIEEMRRIAYLDVVTQLPNRRFVEMSLDAAIDEYALRNKSFGVLLLDVNQFKQINDVYGHGCGDRVLRDAGETLVSSFRPTDVVGRWGGDEFVAVARHVSRKTLDALAKRCAATIANAAIPTGAGKQISLRISIGATLVQPGETRAELIGRADSLMYQSKSCGRAVSG